jgi:hypothetical protein
MSLDCCNFKLCFCVIQKKKYLFDELCCEIFSTQLNFQPRTAKKSYMKTFTKLPIEVLVTDNCVMLLGFPTDFYSNSLLEIDNFIVQIETVIR